MVNLLMERFADDAVFRNIAELTEANLRRSGVECLEDDQTVVFVDVSNYTSCPGRAAIRWPPGKPSC